MLRKSEKSVVLLLQQDQPYKTKKNNKQTIKTVLYLFPWIVTFYSLLQPVQFLEGVSYHMIF